MRMLIMVIIILMCLLAIVSLNSDAIAEDTIIPDVVEVPAKKLIFPDWLKDKTLKYSFVSTFCVRQAVTGLVESSKFSGNKIVAEDDYHIYRTAEDVSSIATGWLGYALYQNKRMTKWEKVRIAFGAACIGRNLREMAYRANRTGDMFNYGDYTFNEKTLVYIGWNSEKKKFVDLYVSGVGKQGVFIDVAFWFFGLWAL